MFNRVREWMQNTLVRDQLERTNPKFDLFDRLDDQDVIMRHSVIDKAFDDPAYHSGHDSINSYKQLVYGKLSTDKPKRLSFYRNMAVFPEVSDAIDEIADACYNVDENGDFIHLNFSKHSALNEQQQKVLEKEFDEFIGIYSFESDHFTYFRDFVIDGELCWENIVDEDPEKQQEHGIIGANRIPPESYEFLVDTKNRIRGIVLNAAIDNSSGVAPDKQSTTYRPTDSYDYVKHLDVKNIYAHRYDNKEMIAFPQEQLTHCTSGLYNTEKTNIYPVLEKARRAYRQLSLLEDASIIYRLVRAPERLVFNVDTGKLPPSKAEELVRKLMKRYQSKKVYDPTTGSIVSDYDPHQLLESYWFIRPEGSAGTDVSTIGGGGGFGEMEDIEYFLRKLYMSLKVPFLRYQEASGAYEKFQETITYEEYRFAKFVIRIQSQVAAGITDSFRAHLKLKGLWTEYKLNDRSMRAQFIPPTAFEIYEQQKLLQIKIERYDTIANHEEFSKELAMKKYLDMSEAEIRENNKRLDKEAVTLALRSKKAAAVEEVGNITGEPLVSDEEGEEAEEPGF